MIRNLAINNIALIDSLEIDFNEGLTVLSGETGSGKSIIIDSLAFVLGDRADKTLIKHGKDSASVSALFDIENNEAVCQKLQEYGFEPSEQLLVSRKMTMQGKNEIRIQGKISTSAILKDICGELVDIFGQGEHLALLKEKNQLSVLDGFCQFGGVDEQLVALHHQLGAVNKQLLSFGGSDAERQRTLDILSFQIEEISSANLSVEEEEQLVATHKRMVNIEKIATAVGIAVESLNGENGAISAISRADKCLQDVSHYEESANQLSGRLESARLEIEDVASTLEDILSQTEFSPYEVDKLQERLDKIRTLKRKYGGSVEETLKFLKNAEEQFETLQNATEIIEQLSKQKQKVLEQMYVLAQQKSQIRHQASVALAKAITSELDDLGMRGTQFNVQFNEQPTFDQYCKNPLADGYDVVAFLMSANPGEPLKPLSKVISGGEMSRFMLAVKNITARIERIPTMVFDEIDTGISGAMAQKVAVKLAKIASDKTVGYQSIVITHLPQIVAMADNNLFIEKITEDCKTHTTVSVLDFDGQVAEVSRLMGGVGEHSLQSATDLIAWCNQTKQNF